MTNKEKKNFYNDLVDLFDWVYNDPSKVNDACKKIFDKIEYFEQKALEVGYDEGFEDGQDAGYSDCLKNHQDKIYKR